MSIINPLTLINKQTGNLAFKIFSFDNNSCFDHIQRLNYYSLVWIKKGRGKAKVDFSEYSFSKNSLFSFTPYQPFMFLAKGPFEGVVLNFHSDFFCIHKHQKQVACNGVLFNNIYSTPMLKIDSATENEFEELLAKIEKEILNSSLAQYEILLSYLKIILITASRLKNSQYSTSVKILEEKSSQPFILRELKSKIEENYKEKHSASDYANLLNITPKALSKITKNYFNKTLTDLISERIIIEAKRELYLTNKTIKEIAFSLGYNDEHYFSRFFKNKVDISPKLFRSTVGFGRADVK